MGTCSSVSAPVAGADEGNKGSKELTLANQKQWQSVIVSKAGADTSNKRVNQYEVVQARPLGVGATSAVYLVKDTNDPSRLYAMKVAKKSILRRVTKQMGAQYAINGVKHELAVLKKLRHPNITMLHEVIDDPTRNKLYLILEYVSGGFVCRSAFKNKFTEQRTWELARDIIQGLTYLHAQRIVHRDLKVENVLLSEDGRAKLCDFGIAHVHDDDEDDSMQGLWGTWIYQSPECFRSEPYSGRAADMWAVGVILFRLICGKLPYTGKSKQAVRRALTKKLRIPRHVNPALANLISRLLDKDPKMRLTLPQTRVHPWITRNGTKMLESLTVQQKDRVYASPNDMEHAITAKFRLPILAKLKVKAARAAKRARSRARSVEQAELAVNKQLAPLKHIGLTASQNNLLRPLSQFSLTSPPSNREFAMPPAMALFGGSVGRSPLRAAGQAPVVATALGNDGGPNSASETAMGSNGDERKVEEPAQPQASTDAFERTPGVASPAATPTPTRRASGSDAAKYTGRMGTSNRRDRVRWDLLQPDGVVHSALPSPVARSRQSLRDIGRSKSSDSLLRSPSARDSAAAERASNSTKRVKPPPARTPSFMDRMRSFMMRSPSSIYEPNATPPPAARKVAAVVAMPPLPPLPEAVAANIPPRILYCKYSSLTREHASGLGITAKPGAKVVKNRHFPQMAGPTRFSNWVVPGHLLVGEYPGSRQTTEHRDIAERIVQAGVDTVVCMQPARETRRLPQYKQTMLEAFAARCAGERPPDGEFEFLRFAIVDGLVGNEAAVLQFVKDLERRIRSGRVLRAGTIASLLLGRLYGLSGDEAMTRVGLYHDCRVQHRGFDSPSSEVQLRQIHKLLGSVVESDPPAHLIRQLRDMERARVAAAAGGSPATRRSVRQAAVEDMSSPGDSRIRELSAPS